MKARSREIFTAVLFDAPGPEDAARLSPGERRVFEDRYDVRLLTTEIVQPPSPRWVFGRIGSLNRCLISPGDYILTGESGTRVVAGRFFEEHYEVLEG